MFTAWRRGTGIEQLFSMPRGGIIGQVLNGSPMGPREFYAERSDAVRHVRPTAGCCNACGVIGTMLTIESRV